MATPSPLETIWTELRATARFLGHVPRLLPAAAWSPAKLLEERARNHADVLGIAHLDRRFTWSEVDAQVSRYARALQRSGVGAGDVVALLMDNRPEFLFVVTALSRLRAIGALINTNILGHGLVHAITIAKPKKVVFGSEHEEKIVEVQGELSLGRDDLLVQQEPEAPEHRSAFPSFDALVAAEPETAPTVEGTPRADEKFCYIYTSGTTGLPKAAIITNQRFMAAGALFGASILALAPGEVSYVALPLYHSSAMFAGWGAALSSGGAIALRKKFSASQFLDDVRRYDAHAFVYIGELCRYLLNQPERPDDRDHHLRVATGNGLRPDIWERFQKRFGIPLIREFYGATEGNAPIVNLVGTPGMVGRLRSGQVLLRCDPETGEAIRDPSGRCTRVGPGETGLLVAKITRMATYDGYVDAQATQKKVLADVFAGGDRYFNSGDLLTLHDHGWLSFADRVGDTFRWKGENVSTNEVAEILNGAPGVLESNVYGVEVPGTEGRAGMASLNCDERFSLADFAAYVKANLPVYQRPYFVRLQRDMRITGTFKHQKVDYRQEGYDPHRVRDPLYLLDGDAYVALDEETHRRLLSGELRLR